MRTLKQIYKKCKFKNREIQDQDNVLKEKQKQMKYPEKFIQN